MFKESTEDEIPTAFPVVSCPANMIVLQTVSAGISGRWPGAMLTGLVG